MRREDRQLSDIKDIERIIEKADVCRIAFADGNVPYIVAMNFGYTGSPQNRIFFHCAPEGRKIEMLRKNNYVCFQMDADHELYTGMAGCDWGMKYSSITGYGTLSIVTSREEKINGLDCIMSHYGGTGMKYDEKMIDRTTILQLDIKEITGKKN